MKKKLSRKWARICIVSAVIWGFFWLITAFTGSLFCFWAGVAFLIPSFLIKLVVLRCPGCEKSSAVPQWTKSGTYFCPRCGTKLEYDDQET